MLDLFLRYRYSAAIGVSCAVLVSIAVALHSRAERRAQMASARAVVEDAMIVPEEFWSGEPVDTRLRIVASLPIVQRVVLRDPRGGPIGAYPPEAPKVHGSESMESVEIEIGGEIAAIADLHFAGGSLLGSGAFSYGLILLGGLAGFGFGLFALRVLQREHDVESSRRETELRTNLRTSFREEVGPHIATSIRDLTAAQDSSGVAPTLNRLNELWDQMMGGVESGNEAQSPNSVFLSHRFHEERLAGRLAHALRDGGFVVVTGKSTLVSIGSEVRERIRDCQYYVALFSAASEEPGETSAWLWEEKGIAVAFQKRMVLLVEGAENPGGIQGDLEVIRFQRDKFDEALDRAVERLNAHAS